MLFKHIWTFVRRKTQAIDSGDYIITFLFALWADELCVNDSDDGCIGLFAAHVPKQLSFSIHPF